MSGGPVLNAYFGVVYRRSFFDGRVFEVPNECVFADDVFLSAFLAVQGFSRTMHMSSGENKQLPQLWDKRLGNYVGSPGKSIGMCDRAIVGSLRPDVWRYRRRRVLWVPDEFVLLKTVARDLLSGGRSTSWVGGRAARGSEEQSRRSSDSIDHSFDADRRPRVAEVDARDRGLYKYYFWFDAVYSCRLIRDYFLAEFWVERKVRYDHGIFRTCTSTWWSSHIMTKSPIRSGCLHSVRRTEGKSMDSSTWSCGLYQLCPQF